MTVASIVRSRISNILRAFAQDSVPPLVEVDGPAALAGLAESLDEFTEGDLETARLGRRALSNVVMIGGPGGRPDTASVWVRAQYSDYRAAYAAFLRKAYGIKVARADLQAYDVDHLLNRARAGNGNTLLRVEALPLSVNRQWGSILEKLASQSNVAGNLKTRRLMSYLIAAKVAGLPPPATLTDGPSRERLIRGLAALGLREQEVRDGLDNMLGHIARNL